MKKYFVFFLLLISCSKLLAQKSDDHVIDTSKEVNYLFVLSAATGTYEDKKLTLEMVPVVTYFSDRPHRISGHFPLDRFPTIWNQSRNGFSEIPPNAILSIYHEDAPIDIVLEISSPVVKKGKIYFTVEKIIEGKIPASFNEASLFIDLFKAGIDFPGFSLKSTVPNRRK